jgi:hypothetical protein
VQREDGITPPSAQTPIIHLFLPLQKNNTEFIQLIQPSEHALRFPGKYSHVKQYGTKVIAFGINSRGESVDKDIISKCDYPEYGT